MDDEKLPFDPTKELRSDYWQKMKLTDLWSQKMLLDERILFASSAGKIEMQAQLMRGSKQLEAVIRNKGNSSDEFGVRTPTVF
jgi:hypothetical protein